MHDYSKFERTNMLSWLPWGMTTRMIYNQCMLNASIISLLLSNLAVVYGVIFFDWNLANLIFLFWFENIIIGFYTAIKILSTKSNLIAKIFLLIFFAMHFGLFTFVHGTFLAVFFGKQFVFSASLFIGIASMFLSHGVSLFTHYIRPKKYLTAHPVILMMKPYPRIIVVHLTILFSGIFMLMNQTVVPLIIFTLLKSIVDLASHLLEHRSDNVISIKPFGSKVVFKLFPNFENQVLSIYKAQVSNGQWSQIAQTMDAKTRQEVENYFKSKGIIPSNTTEQTQDSAVL